MSAREAVLLIIIVGAIVLTLQFQDVISELHQTGETPSEQGTARPQAGPGG